jgi:hypothetical protein
MSGFGMRRSWRPITVPVSPGESVENLLTEIRTGYVSNNSMKRCRCSSLLGVRGRKIQRKYLIKCMFIIRL